MPMFLSLLHCSVEVEVVEKRINRGGGCELEIPIQCKFFGPAKTRLVKKIRNSRKRA